jgi:ATP-dependent Clp protease adaptor protein ClpS
MIATASGLFMANRLMPYALNFTSAVLASGANANRRPQSGLHRRMQATELRMVSAAEISPVRESQAGTMRMAPRRRNLRWMRMRALTLCSTPGELSDRLASISKLCAVNVRLRPIGVSIREAALSIRRVIRANFTRWVGILAGRRLATPPAADNPAVRKSNEPMPLIDVTIHVPARLADDDRKRKGDGSPGTAVITKTRPQTKRPNLYRVLLLNDDYTPMEFVVHVLERFFNKDHETAHRIMMHVHQHGIGECGVYTYEVAETKVTQVMDFARKHQHPLQCIMEKK